MARTLSQRSAQCSAASRIGSIGRSAHPYAPPSLTRHHTTRHNTTSAVHATDHPFGRAREQACPPLHKPKVDLSVPLDVEMAIAGGGGGGGGGGGASAKGKRGGGAGRG